MFALMIAIIQLAQPIPAKAALTEFNFKCSVYAAREANDTQLWARGYRDVFRLSIAGARITLSRGDLHGSFETTDERIQWHSIISNVPVNYVKAKTRADYPFMLSLHANKAETTDRWTTGFKFELNGSEAVAFLTSSNRSNSDEHQMYSGDLLFPNGLKMQDGAIVYNVRLGACY